MHIPSSFNEENPEVLLDIMRANAFATIITNDEDGKPIATSLPFLVIQRDEKIILQAHFAKTNPQWQQLEDNKQVLVIFNGPHCYISPSWYKNGGVPTWNYVTVHAYGAATLYASTETAELIETLSDQYEKSQEKPWVAKSNYSEKMLDHIVGFEINVQELLGKVKIGQNKSGEDLLGVLQGLQNTSSEQDLAIAGLIKKYLESKD